MKNRFKNFVCLIAPALLVACGSKGSSGDSAGSPVSKASFPDYGQAAPGGQLFGASWTAMKAGYTQDSSSGLITVQLASAGNDECTVSPAAKSTVYVTLNEIKENLERLTDASRNQFDASVTFVDFTASPVMNVLADRARYLITQVTASSFNLSVYAHGVEGSGRLSEINGKINVVNCATRMAFSDWAQMAATYQVTSFDGAAVDPQVAYVTVNTDDFKDANGQPLRAVEFPLMSSVSNGSSVSLNFGPIEGLGTSTKSVANGTTVYTYSYSGPINFKGGKYTLNLQLQVRSPGSASGSLEVNYTAEVPGEIPKTSHSFVLAPF